MEMMSSCFKNMDKSFLKNTLSQQMNMNISDEELTNMQNMMTPDMLKMMSQMDMKNMGNLPNQSRNADSFSSLIGKDSKGEVPSMGNLNNASNISNMMQNPQMMSSMMDTMKNNPEMLKNMSKMLGNNHPLSGFLEKSNPNDLQRIIGFIQKFMQFCSKIYSLFLFLKRNKYLVLMLIVSFIVYKYKLI